MTVRILRLAVLLAAAIPVLPALASAEVVTIGASQDNTLYEPISKDGFADKSNGAGATMFSGKVRDAVDTLNEVAVRRAVLKFDVAGSIPAGATITGVSLSLRCTKVKVNTAYDFSLHRLTSAWGEGTSNTGNSQQGRGATPTAGDATWRHTFYPSQFWVTPGGSFVAGASATTAVGPTGSYAWGSTSGMVADVQAWLDNPAQNFGWILVGNEVQTQTAKQFGTRENTTTANRPSLTVTFLPAAPTGACCAMDGNCSVVPSPGGTCTGTYQGDGSSCTPNLCPQPTGACCLPNATATCSEVTEASCSAQSGTFQGNLSTCAAATCPVVLTPFLDPLPVPAVAQPTSGAPGGAASYAMAAREVQQQLHSDLPPTTVWGYGDGPSGAAYPGPTIEATVGQPIQVSWRNDLRDTSQPGPPLRTSHYFPVDTCPHGATENMDARIVTHLHGGHVSAASDGYPEDTLPPGQQALYHYPNTQLPATLWYHDHALGITRLNVQMGLAGFYLIRDALEQGLNLPSGPYEIPLAIQDRSFNPDGSLQYPEMWMEHVFGDTILVNGKVWPYLDVARGKYRFRILNGSGSRTYALRLSSAASFSVIGMEGGLLAAPVPVNEVTLGPGERAEVVVDFAPYPAGSEVALLNSAPAPFPGQAGVGVVPNVMLFRVTSTVGHTGALPAALRPFTPIDPATATVSREFHLEKGPADDCSPFHWRITSIANGTVVGHMWDDVSEYPALGTTEIWSFANKSGVTHPIHMHLVMFQVLDRQAFDIVDGQIVPVGAPVPPPAHEAGWKDTVQVGPNEIVRLIARFANPLDPAGPTFTGLFPYHCHILEHEDHEMMRQYQATTSCGDGVPGLPVEECDDGNTLADDGCSPTCQIEDECADGLDNDGDGRIDHPSDTGCSSATDFLETTPAYACDNGLDDDGDGFTDVPDDPGCRLPTSTNENPQCQDGVDNDGQTGIDFDGGASRNGGVPISTPDPQCTAAWVNQEAVTSSGGGCGLGPELLLLAPLAALRRLRPRRTARPGARSGDRSG
jgi:spore coat protein A